MNLRLRDLQAKRNTSIILILAYEGRQYKMSTGAQVKPEQWNKKTQRAVISPMLSKMDNLNNAEANAKLDALSACYLRINTYLCNNPEELQNIRMHMRNYFNSSDMRVKKEETAKAILNTALRDMSKRLAWREKSETQYRTFLRNFIEYMDRKELHNSVRLFTSFLISDYALYLLKEGKSATTINLSCNFLCKLINEEIRKGERYRNLNIPEVSFNKVKDSRTKEDGSHFEITDAEEQKLWEVDNLSENERIARDAFLILIETGLRVSDLNKIIEAEWNDGIAVINTTKKNVNAYVRMTDKLRILLNRNKKVTMDYVLLGYHFKKVAKKADMRREIEIKKSKGAGIITEKKTVSEALTFHSARVTKATRLVRAGVAKDNIILMLGWSDDNMLNKIYERTTVEDKINQIKKLESKEEKQEKVEPEVREKKNERRKSGSQWVPVDDIGF